MTNATSMTFIKSLECVAKNDPNFTKWDLEFFEINDPFLKTYSEEQWKVVTDALRQNRYITSLRGAYFSLDRSQPLLISLMFSKSIAILEMHKSIFGANFGSFSDSLKDNKKLLSLCITSSELEDLKYLGRSIRVNRVLKTLNLESTKFDNESFHFLASGLKENQALTELNLSYCALSDKNIIDLSNNLNTSLRILKLHHITIGPKASHALGTALKISHLTTLNISFSNIEDVTSLAEGLKNNAYLLSLDLSGNPFGDLNSKFPTFLGKTSGKALALALKTNKTLTQLSVRACQMKEDIRWFADAISTNTTLQKFDLSMNQFYEQGNLKFLEAMKTNPSLIELNVDDIGCHINEINEKVENNLKASASVQSASQALIKLSAAAKEENLKVDHVGKKDVKTIEIDLKVRNSVKLSSPVNHDNAERSTQLDLKIRQSITLKIVVPDHLNWHEVAKKYGLKSVKFQDVRKTFSNTQDKVKDLFFTVLILDKGATIYRTNDALKQVEEEFENYFFESDEIRLRALCQAITHYSRANSPLDAIYAECRVAASQMDKANSLRKKHDLLFPNWEPTNVYHKSLMRCFKEQFDESKITREELKNSDAKEKENFDYILQLTRNVAVKRVLLTDKFEKEIDAIRKEISSRDFELIEFISDIKKLQKHLQSLPFGERRVQILNDYFTLIELFESYLEMDSQSACEQQDSDIIFDIGAEKHHIRAIKKFIRRELVAFNNKNMALYDYELISLLLTIENDFGLKKDIVKQIGYPQTAILQFLKVCNDKKLASEKFNAFSLIGTPESKGVLEKINKSFSEKICQLMSKMELNRELVEIKNNIIKTKSIESFEKLSFNSKKTEFEIRAILSDLLLRAIILKDVQAYLESNQIIKQMKQGKHAGVLEKLTKDDLSAIETHRVNLLQLQQMAHAIHKFLGDKMALRVGI